jgi:predicted RNase H-like nuclease
MATLMGVDGCTRGWIAAVDEGSQRSPSCHRFASIDALMERAPAVLAIDVPIGLLDKGARECDVAARRLLGARRGSVFTAPIRPALKAHSHRHACALRLEVEGKRVSIQAWGINYKVLEIDDALRIHEEWRGCIREVHPEVCFYHLNGNRPLTWPKKHAEGRRERLKLLRPQLGDAVTDALTERKRLGCAADDIIDAFVALWTARRIADGTAIRIPAAPPADTLGIPMEMSA